MGHTLPMTYSTKKPVLERKKVVKLTTLVAMYINKFGYLTW